MILWLKPHPVGEPPSIRIAVDVVRPRPNSLRLTYRVTGAVAGLRIPPPASPERRDRLWETTCFEAFPAGDDAGYEELNLSPSGEWAAYRFAAYRSGMAPVEMPPPTISVSASADRLETKADLRLPRARRSRLGLAAVIEEMNGRKSWWALAHPPGAPDFHHPDCFALELPPPA